MKIVKIAKGHGPAENLYIAEADIPEPGPNQALVKVYSFGITHIDITQRNIDYPLPHSISPVLGLEFSGVIVRLGPESTNVPNCTSGPGGFAVGEQVLGLVSGGAYAEYVVCDYRTLLVKPPGISMNEAAAIPMTWFTAVQAVKYDGCFQKRDKALVNDAELPVGRAMVRLLQILGCRRVYCVGKNLKKQDLKLHGALIDEVIILDNVDEGLVKKYDPQGLQLVINPRGLGASQGFRILAAGKHMVFLSYHPLISLNLFDAMTRHLHLHGTMVRGLSTDEQSQLRDFIDEHILQRFANRKLSVQMDALFPLNCIQRAHKWAEEHPEHKIVVSVIDQPYET